MRIETKSATTRSLCLAFAMLAAVALTAVGCGGGGGGAADPQVARGQKLYQQTCATCHGADGHGMPKLGKDLHDNQFTRSLTDEQMLAFLKQGRPAWHEDNTQGVDMPPKGGNPALSEDDLLAIIAFQRTWTPR